MITISFSFFCGKTYKVYSQQISSMQYSITDYNHHIVHEIPRIYSSYHWSLVPPFKKFIHFNWRLITLQYCSGFAIHWHESAMGVHVSPILNPLPYLGMNFIDNLKIKLIQCAGMTLRDEMGREVGGGFRMANTCAPMTDSCWCMANPIQYCKIISLQLK